MHISQIADADGLEDYCFCFYKSFFDFDLSIYIAEACPTLSISISISIFQHQYQNIYFRSLPHILQNLPPTPESPERPPSSVTSNFHLTVEAQYLSPHPQIDPIHL